METMFHNLHGASYFGTIDLSDAHHQIELDEEAKDICTINTSQGLFMMCRLPHGLKTSSSIFQNCIELTFKRIKVFVTFQDYVLVYGTTKEQFDERRRTEKKEDKINTDGTVQNQQETNLSLSTCGKKQLLN